LEPGQAVARLWHLRGRARAALGQLSAAIGDLQAASAASLRQNTSPQTWRILADLARLDDLQGRPTEAEVERAAARSLVEALAASVADLDARAHFLEQAAGTIISRQ
jgi:hypothetical protein